jgi:hypothetical protein
MVWVYIEREWNPADSSLWKSAGINGKGWQTVSTNHEHPSILEYDDNV